LPQRVALFRGNDPVTVLAAIATVPIFVWELSLGVWLVVKGFRPSPITAGMVPTG
jgi:3-polyprenyl-4-hydroxybenzoate decarboxylase